MQPDERSTRELVLGAAEDLVVDFLYYDRKEDEDLPRGAIEAAISMGLVTEQEIIDVFAANLREGLR